MFSVLVCDKQLTCAGKNTAKLWERNCGRVVKPTNMDGTVADNASELSNAELGPGLYLMDNLGM